MYQLFLASLLCYFLGEYAIFPLRPSNLKKQTWTDFFINLGISAVIHFVVLGIALGFWGLALAAVLMVFHFTVNMLSRLLFDYVSGARTALTLIDLTLHIVCMYASATIISLVASPINYTTALVLRIGAMAAMAVLFYPALAKTLLVDGFPKYYSDRPLFTLTEWLFDAAYGLLTGIVCMFLLWWLALPLTLVFSLIYFFLASKVHEGRPVLVLTKIGVLLVLVPCFMFVFF